VASTDQEPIVIKIRVFQADDGWRFRIDWWIGNVDTMSAPVSGSFESKKGFVRRQAAVRRAAEFSAGIGAAQA
jgi:hypothetical protein